MSSSDRTALIGKLFKAAKKENTAVVPPSNRTVLEHMVYACCLENSHFEEADEAFALLSEKFFDWNEVRVTTVSELAEVMKNLSHPIEAAITLKKVLHGVFEAWYNFDLEFLKKENLRKTVQQLEKFKGVGPFVVSYTAQVALGGHSIPLDRSMLELLYVLGIVSESDAVKGKVTGLERAVPKSKGIEFFSVVHPIAVAFHKTPFKKGIREALLKIAPDAKERFPKRGKTGSSIVEPEVVEPEKKTMTRAAVKRAAKEKAAAEKLKKKTGTETSGTRKKKAAVKKSSTKKPVTRKKATKKPATKKPKAKKSATKKPAAKSSTKRPSTKKRATSKPVGKKTTSKRGGGKSSTKQLARKKPR